MKNVSILIASALLAATPALAGINPASPGLPTASTAYNGAESITYTAFSAINNRSSSMCVDCHTVQPKAGGSHYVNASDTAGATNSGGSGIGAAGAIVTRDNGAYFKALLWNANGAAGVAAHSKYGNAAAGSVAVAAINGTRTATAVAANTLNGYDIICESCHNIVVNEAGGNNLLATQPNNEWQNTAAGVVSEICVGCHGFMYTTNAANSTAPANTNYSITGVNENEVAGGHKANNENHWVKGVMYPQNHHVMTGDNIDNTRANARLLWADTDIVHYTANPIANNVVRGTLPQKAAWVNLTKPTAAGNLTCTNCHSPAHGTDASPAASILRNATYTTAAHALGPIARISDRAGWKKINDLAYCTQCHQ